MISSPPTTPSTPPSQPAPLTRHPWQGWHGILLAGICLILYLPVLQLLAQEWWHDPEATHGLFVALLSLYVAWKRRGQWARAIMSPSLWGLPVLLGGLSLLILGSLGAELFLMGVSLPIVLTGLILFLLGLHHLRILAFPLGFSLLMVPLPSMVVKALTLPLQLLAARMGTWALEILAIPVYREGTIIFFPRSALEILEACSGMRSLAALVTLAIILAYVKRRPTWHAVCLALLAVPITLVANALRIWGTGLVAYRYGTEAAEGFYHAFGGWVVFGIALTLLVVASVLLSYGNSRVRPQETRL